MISSNPTDHPVSEELEAIHALIHQSNYDIIYPESETEDDYPVARRILAWHQSSLARERALHAADLARAVGLLEAVKYPDKYLEGQLLKIKAQLNTLNKDGGSNE